MSEEVGIMGGVKIRVFANDAIDFSHSKVQFRHSGYPFMLLWPFIVSIGGLQCRLMIVSVMTRPLPQCSNYSSNSVSPPSTFVQHVLAHFCPI